MSKPTGNTSIASHASHASHASSEIRPETPPSTYGPNGHGVCPGAPIKRPNPNPVVHAGNPLRLF